VTGEYLRDRRAMVEQALDRHLPAASTQPKVIHEAMRYAVLGGGKRIRPILAIAAAEACDANVEPLLQHFAALELIHTYSLVHDDLPALDNDDLRRGRKTTHVVFGEAMAILAGDALLTEAFSWLSQPLKDLPAERQLKAITAVATAVDSTGMIGGQVADLESTSSNGAPAPSVAGSLEHEGRRGGGAPLERLQFIHRNKTGKLITASVLLGGILAGADIRQLAHLDRYGQALGLAFQIVDDLLDQEESSATLGKTAGKDLAQGKLTYPAVMGTAAAREELASLLRTAEENAGMIPGRLNYLAQIARFICERRS
jgi:geranylgeranyl diphosphate synthase, type II